MNQTISSKRQPFLNYLRVFTMLCVLMVHCVYVYVQSNLNIFSNKIPIFLISPLIILSSFTMPLFFMIAGYSIYLMSTQYSFDEILKERFYRIGIPWFISMLLLSIFHLGLFIPNLSTHCAGQSPSDCFQIFWQQPFIKKLTSLETELSPFNTTGSLWFLYYLIWIYILHSLIILIKKHLNLSRFLQKYFLQLSIPCSILLSLQIGAWYFYPPESLIPNVGYVFFYGIFYAFGYFYIPNILEKKLLPTFNESSEAIKNPFSLIFILGLFFVAIILISIFILFLVPKFSLPFHLPSATAMICNILMPCISWCMISGLFLLFKITCHKKNLVISYLSQASYWIYLTQIPLILWLQYKFNTSPLDSTKKVMLMYVTALVILIVSYQIFVRHTFIGRILRGKK